MTIVKICGINAADAFDAAVAADYLGFVFYPASPRYVLAETAAALSTRAAGGPKRVGLFVEPTRSDIAAVLRHVALDALQIYGSTDHLADIRSAFGLPIWQAVGVRAADDLPRYAGPADRLVIEAKPPEGATRPGGNAITFDWSILRNWHAPVPWFLAGGLDPSNVGSAIRQTGATAVDVSSGVERAKGVKDPALIRAFIAAARHPLQ